MKKIVLSLLILLCVFGAFAAKNSLLINVVPYGFNFVTKESKTKPVGRSTFGIGGEVALQKEVKDGLFAEAGLDVVTFKMKGKDKNLNSILYFIGVGYEYELTNELALAAHGDLGLDLRVQDKKVTEVFTLKAGVSGSYAVCDACDVVVGCDCQFGLESGDKALTSYRLLPVVGLSVNL